MPPKSKPSAKAKPAKSEASKSQPDSAANIGFEAKLWLAADKLRSNIDAAEYKHVVLGIIFLKYISDAFEETREKLLAGKGDYKGANPEVADEYLTENGFWVRKARWLHLQSNANWPNIRWQCGVNPRGNACFAWVEHFILYLAA